LLLLTFAMGALPANAAETRWPTPQEIDAARAAHPIPGMDELAKQPVPTVPAIQLQRPAIDIESIARQYAGIPAEMNYIEQLRRFEYQCATAGIDRVHGHRHQYAQTRYREITGWAAPAAGGPRSKELTREQKAIDYEARVTISMELGHTRGAIVGVYLGR
jgi:hypothetical protein